MPVPFFLQRFLVWSRCYLADPVEEVQGITFAGHPDYDARSQVARLDEALTAISDLDAELYREVREHIRLIAVTKKLRSPLAPYGAGFLPGNAAEWNDRRPLAGWLVWTAAYVRASREAAITRANVDAAGGGADQAREDFLDAYEVSGKQPWSPAPDGRDIS
jgi:hypothetical protein